MRQWAGGTVSQGLVDEYPLPAAVVVVDLTVAEVERLLGLRLAVDEIQRILESLEFKIERTGPDALRVTVPDHRLDIGTEVVGKADLIEEIARVYGYERIPETLIADDVTPAELRAALRVCGIRVPG